MKSEIVIDAPGPVRIQFQIDVAMNVTHPSQRWLKYFTKDKEMDVDIYNLREEDCDMQFSDGSTALGVSNYLYKIVS